MHSSWCTASFKIPCRSTRRTPSENFLNIGTLSVRVTCRGCLCSLVSKCSLPSLECGRTANLLVRTEMSSGSRPRGVDTRRNFLERATGHTLHELYKTMGKRREHRNTRMFTDSLAAVVLLPTFLYTQTEDEYSRKTAQGREGGPPS